VIELPELTRPPGTAVVVEWSVNLPSLESASIEFGRGGDYGDAEYVAPVDLLAPHYRTVLLGMKSAKDYQFRIIARSANRVCESEPQTVRSGYLRAGLPSIRVEPADLPVDGFSVTCDLSNQMLTGGVTNAYIFDADGDIVWNYYVDHWGDCTAARMSFDGRSMWIANANPRGARGSLVHVSMDGEQVDEFSLPDRHHDIAVLDDGKVAIIEYEDGDPQGCDVIRELDPVTGTSQTLFAVRDAVPSGDRPCTTNAIEYWPEQGLYTVSVSGSSRIVAFDRAGTLRWVFGGGEVDGASWDGQNAHSLFGDHLLFLAEQPAGQLLEFALDASGSSGTLVWEHTSEHPSVVVGDVARLANGNTLVTYGTAGVTEELDPDGAIVQQVTSGMACGSMTRRHTLYGPPPPYAE
jgi:hypothetical protein